MTAPSCARARRGVCQPFRRTHRDVYRDPARLVRKDREQLVHGPIDLLKSILAEGEKGLTLQRYKGLGEMNPEPAVGNHARPRGAHAAAGQGR